MEKVIECRICKHFNQPKSCHSINYVSSSEIVNDNLSTFGFNTFHEDLKTMPCDLCERLGNSNSDLPHVGFFQGYGLNIHFVCCPVCEDLKTQAFEDSLAQWVYRITGVAPPKKNRQWVYVLA